MATVVARLRQVAAEVRANNTDLRPGRAFEGSMPRLRTSFERLTTETRVSRDVIADQLEALAAAVENAARAFAEAEASLVSSLDGFLGGDAGSTRPPSPSDMPMVAQTANPMTATEGPNDLRTSEVAR